MNVIIISGRLVKDIEVNTYGNNTKVVSNTIAVYKSKNEDGSTNADFIDFKCFNYAAEGIQNCKKGDYVAMEGSIEKEEWTTQAGEKRSRVIVKADRITLVGTAQNNGAEEKSNENTAQAPKRENNANVNAVAPSYDDSLPY
jgi:single stranded DNA-binding protein